MKRAGVSCDWHAAVCQWVLATTTREDDGDMVSLCHECASTGRKPQPRHKPRSAPHNKTRNSIAAAKSVEHVMSDQERIVFAAINGAPDGLTREQVCNVTGITNQAACARLNSLETNGILHTDGNRLASTGRMQAVYYITQKQKRAA